MEPDTRVAITGFLLLALGFLLLVDEVEASTNWSPNQPDNGYTHGMTVRACSTNGMATTPAPRITAPSGLFQNLVGDSDGCVSFRVDEAGTWTLTYTSASIPATAMTSRITVAPPPPPPDETLEETAMVGGLWLILVLASRFVRPSYVRAGIMLPGYPILAMAPTPTLFGALLLVHTALVVYDVWTIIGDEP